MQAPVGMPGHVLLRQYTLHLQDLLHAPCRHGPIQFFLHCKATAASLVTPRNLERPREKPVLPRFSIATTSSRVIAASSAASLA